MIDSSWLACSDEWMTGRGAAYFVSSPCPGVPASVSQVRRTDRYLGHAFDAAVSLFYLVQIRE